MLVKGATGLLSRTLHIMTFEGQPLVDLKIENNLSTTTYSAVPLQRAQFSH